MGERGVGKDDRQLWQSQNYLRSSEYVSGLLNATDINKGDVVVEIGPGKGIITEQLSKRALRVIAVEADRGLVAELRGKFSKSKNVEIVGSDFLRWDLPRYSFKVFANIPFNMTSDMVSKLLFADNPPTSTYLIMQDKAAGRFMGPPKGPMSQMSALLMPFFDMGVVERIDRSRFYPSPSVDAVLARFIKKQNPVIEFSQRNKYKDFVVYGFNQWKPTFAESFRGIFTSRQLDILASSYGIRNLKPSELSADQWVSAFGSFAKFVPMERQNEVRGAEKRLRGKQKSMTKWHRTR